MQQQTFKCKCLNTTGDLVIEKIYATDLDEVKKVLQSRSLKLVTFTTMGPLHRLVRKIQKRPLTATELISFCDQFYFVFSSGTNLMEGLHIIEKENRNKKMNDLFQEISRDIGEGMSLSYSLKRNEHMFPDILIYMVETGEISGNLEEIFLEMKEYFIRQQEIKRKVSGAMIQPAFLVFFGAIVLLYFLNSILPELMENLEIKEEQLPLVTKAIMQLSDIVRDQGAFILMGIVGLFVSWVWMMKNRAFRYVVHRTLLKVPIIGKAIIYLETFKLSIALSLFLKSDVSIVKALDIVSKLMRNEVAKKSVTEARHTILEGMELHQGLRKVEFFEDSFIKYMEVGEKTGNLEEVSKNLTSQYKLKVDAFIQKTLALMEPTMTVMMTVVIGILVMSIALPIFNMVDYIQ